MELEAIEQIKDKVVKGMLDYLSEWNVEHYTPPDVKTIEKLLVDYLNKMKTLKQNKENYYRSIVKSLNLELNRINDKCDGPIIETDQREDICDFIIQIALFYGYINEEIDITEECRER